MLGKKNQRVINRTALIGPFLGPLVYMGGNCPVILCGSVCHCVNLSDRYWVYWRWRFRVCDRVRLWGGGVRKSLSVVFGMSEKCAKSCSKQVEIKDVSSFLNMHHVRLFGVYFSSAPPSSGSRVPILSFSELQLSSKVAMFGPGISRQPGFMLMFILVMTNTLSSAIFQLATLVVTWLYHFFAPREEILLVCSKILWLMHKCGFMLCIYRRRIQAHHAVFVIFITFFRSTGFL